MTSYLEKLLTVLPSDVYDFCEGRDDIYDIRLRRGGNIIIHTANGKHIIQYRMDEPSFDRVFNNLSGGNGYKLEGTLAQGYFTDIFGGRCGCACDIVYTPEGKRAVRVNAVDIRIHSFISCAEEITGYFLKNKRGLLIFSPPGKGKTTVIRDIAYRLSSPQVGMSVCVCDERREFCASDYPPDHDVFIISGEKYTYALNAAVSYLCPDVIIFDEISSDITDLAPLLHSCGIPIIATAHAGSFDDLSRREDISALVRTGIFEDFAGITFHDGDGTHFEYYSSDKAHM